MDSLNWLAVSQRLQALAHTGLAYCENEYDRERYEEIKLMSQQIMAQLSNAPIAQIMTLIPDEIGYQTPKVDIRAIIFKGTDELLMVQEKIDNHNWTVPGGWADVGYTPFEVAEKEVMEETGLLVRAVRLLAVFDKKKHPHPYQPWYVYKFFILCEVTGGELLNQTNETSGIAWIKRNKLPDLTLSTDRATFSQLEQMFLFADNPDLPTHCD
ncbi:NUDIX hydrolase [Emticicia sp. 17c]|uniref:NUDIX hydrolase n=1 Tax=Emticicia sp. 17c TaxID=3127704 RepID=UPI00301C13CA